MGKLQLGMHYATRISIETASGRWSLMSEAAARFVHDDLSDMNAMKTCSRQKEPPVVEGRGGGYEGGGRRGQNSFSPGESCFSCMRLL